MRTGRPDGPPGAAALHVRVHEPGDVALPPVVLVHGSMDRAASFARVVPLLGDRRAVRYDRRGYGRSLGVGPPAGVDAHADDLLAVIDAHLGEPAVVVGHSLGGVVALVAAQRRPELVLAVGAYEAPMPWTPWWPSGTAGGAALAAADGGDPADAAEAFLRRMIGDERWAELGSGQQAARRAEGAALVAEIASLRAGAPYDLAAIGCPVRAATGSASSGHHRRAAEELARLLGAAAPDVVDGATHGAHRTHPAGFARWVASLSPGRGCP